MTIKKGFTLIELLVVIAIIGILSAVGLTSYRSANAKARDSRRQADVQQLRSALEMYKTDSATGRYPTTGQWANGTVLNSYLSGQTIVDPQTKQGYEYDSDGATYTITYDLESDEVGNLTISNP